MTIGIFFYEILKYVKKRFDELLELNEDNKDEL
jgi:hypothetical protein